MLKLDNLDDNTRKALHIAAVMGMSFTPLEIFEVSKKIHAIDHQCDEHETLVGKALKSANEQGILDENVYDSQDECSSDDNSALSEMIVDIGDDNSMHDSAVQYTYTFYHDTWRRVIKSLMLDSWVRDIHMHAAIAIEARVPDNEMRDYSTKVKLFQHWKGSENTIRAAEVALDIGKSFKLLGMNLHSIRVYEDAIDMWKRHDPTEGEERIGGKSILWISKLNYISVCEALVLTFKISQCNDV